VPDWFRDGQVRHLGPLGPQSAAEYGDWYARRMSFQGDGNTITTSKTYGAPSKSVSRTSIATWKADQFDAII